MHALAHTIKKQHLNWHFLFLFSRVWCTFTRGQMRGGSLGLSEKNARSLALATPTQC